MELAGRTNYKQMAEEIGAVLQAAAESADKMQEEARVEAARIRAEAEAELRTACAEGRRILDEARMEADMVRAEAEWHSQELVAQARRQAAERQAGADTRLAAMEQAESQVMDRLAGVGQVLADVMAALREKPGEAPAVQDDVEGSDDDDRPDAKVFFVEFPPAAAARTNDDPEAENEIVLTETPGASLFADDEERSEWAPPGDLPAWWIRGGAQG
jgi:cell division septum initiation protein DivIVA